MNSTEIRMYEKTLLEELVMAILEKDIISLGKFIKDICYSPYFIREQIFWQNFIEFLDNTFSDNDELRRFSVKLEEDGDSYENAKRIIKIIDDAGTKKKAIYISNLTRAYCLGKIDLYKYFKLTQCIIRLTDEDLIFLCDNISSKHIDTDEDYIDDFRNCGYKIIRVNHAAIYRVMENRKSEFHISTPKTQAGVRIIPMMDVVEQAFRDEYKAQKESGFNVQVVDGMSGFIFCNKEGMIHKPSVINLAIKRIYEVYNAEEVIKAKREKRPPVLIPHFSCHHIRHTFCTRFCENETNLKVIQSIMGHANIETTMDIYAEATELKKKEAMKALEKSSDIF